MKHTIRASHNILGEVMLADLHTDEFMGVMDGTFTPLRGYEEIEEQIKRYSQLAFELNSKEANRSAVFQDLRVGIDLLDIHLVNEEGHRYEAAKVEIRDYSDHLGTDGYQVLVYR